MDDRTLVTAEDVDAEEEQALRNRVEALRQEYASVTAEYQQLLVALRAFEVKYDARIGVLLVELDRIELNLEIYQRRLAVLHQPPKTWKVAEEEIATAFQGERERVEAEYREAAGAQERLRDVPNDPPPEVAEAIRKLYRKLARRYHPDLAGTEEERVANELAMRRINAALEAQDLAELERLDLELPKLGDDIPGESRRARIQWLLAEIERLEKVLAETVGSIAQLKSGSLYRLWQQVEQSPGVLDDLETDLRAKITAKKSELDALVLTYRELMYQRVREEE